MKNKNKQPKHTGLPDTGLVIYQKLIMVYNVSWPPPTGAPVAQYISQRDINKAMYSLPANYITHLLEDFWEVTYSGKAHGAHAGKLEHSGNRRHIINDF